MVKDAPSVDPCSLQAAGSRSGASLAEVSAYVFTVTGAARWNVRVAVAANASHLVPGSPSARFFASSAGGFSAEAAIGVFESMTLPGRCPVAPMTPPRAGLPSVPISTVLASAAGSPTSNEVENDPGAGAAAADEVENDPGAGAAPAGGEPTAVPESTIAPPTSRATAGRSPRRREVRTDRSDTSNM